MSVHDVTLTCSQERSESEYIDRQTPLTNAYETLFHRRLKFVVKGRVRSRLDKKNCRSVVAWKSIHQVDKMPLGASYCKGADDLSNA